MIKDSIEFEGTTIEFVYPEELEKELKTQKLEIFERKQYNKGRRKKNAIYIDAGANIGLATAFFQPYAKKIYSIEPNPDIYEALVENTKKFDNVETFNIALANQNGTDFLYSNKGGPLPQTFFGDDTSVNLVRVKLITMFDFFEQNKIDHVDVLKIDVEGAEYAIFPSSPFLKVADKIDYIIGEGHFIESGGFPDSLPYVLKDAGFNRYEIIKDVEPNYFRQLDYFDVITNTKKQWSVPYKTMFEAWRE